jgi:hypothetical protein
MSHWPLYLTFTHEFVLSEERILLSKTPNSPLKSPLCVPVSVSTLLFPFPLCRRLMGLAVLAHRDSNLEPP